LKEPIIPENDREKEMEGKMRWKERKRGKQRRGKRKSYEENGCYKKEEDREILFKILADNYWVGELY
jgi:hypothetical protein